MTINKLNKFPSYCLRCEAKVPAGHGLLVKRSGSWGNWACRCAAVVAPATPVVTIPVPAVPAELTPAEIAARLAECPF